MCLEIQPLPLVASDVVVTNQNTKNANQNTKFANQNNKYAHQNTNYA